MPGPIKPFTSAIQAILDGIASTDSDGDALSYRWRITEAPVNSLAQLSSSAAIRTEFPVDGYGHYKAELIVNDGFLDSVPDQVIIDTRNSAPVASGGADQSALSAVSSVLMAAYPTMSTVMP